MSPEDKTYLIAILADRCKAEAAVDALWHAGFQKDQIGFIVPSIDWREATTKTEGIEENAAEGAVVGSLTGGTLGAVAGVVATAAIPGIGPVISGGLLLGIVGGMSAGAALGAFAGPFIAMGFSEHEANAFEFAIRAGRSVLVVQGGDRREEAFTILRSHAPFQIRMKNPSSSFSTMRAP